MIDKIKGFANLREDVTAVTVQLEHNKRVVEEMTSMLEKEMAQMKEFQNLQVELLEQCRHDLSEITEIKSKLREEVDQFRALNKATQKGIIERFEREMRDSLIKHSKELAFDKSQYDRIRSNVEATARNIFLVNSEVNKLLDISRSLKETDFQLSKYAEALRKEDRNKLELMQKNDQLERLVAKMRRGNQ